MTSTSGAIRVKAFTATMAPNEKPPGKRVDDLIVHGPLMERMGAEQKPDTARVNILGSLHKTLESTGWSIHHDRVFRVRSQHKVRAAQPNTRRPLTGLMSPRTCWYTYHNKAKPMIGQLINFVRITKTTSPNAGTKPARSSLFVGFEL